MYIDLLPYYLLQFASPNSKKINETQNGNNDDNDDTLDEELLAETCERKAKEKQAEANDVCDKAALFKEELRNVLRDRDYYA